MTLFKERLDKIHNLSTLNSIPSDEDGYFMTTNDPIKELQNLVTTFMKTFDVGKKISKKKWGNRRIDQIQKALYDMILGTTTKAKDKPKTTLDVMNEIEDNVSDKDQKFNRNDFERIARTELAATRAGFQLLKARELGFTQVRHITKNDTRVSKACKLHSNKTYKIDYLIRNDKDRIPIHINCRCKYNIVRK